MDQERSELKQQRVATPSLVEELKDCKEKLNNYEIEITDLKDLVKELDDMKAKIDEYKNPSEELLELRNKVDNTTRWCNNIETIFDQLFLFAEHISENWNLNHREMKT